MLAAALRFNDEDLQANRAGRLTIRQRNRVFVWRRALIIALLLITAFIGIISAIVILAVLTGTAVSEVGILLALGGEVITAGLAFLVWSLRQHYNTYLQAGRVQQVEGPVTMYQLRERHNNRARTAYYLRVDDQEFAIPQAALSVFTDGAPYSVYYVAEPLTLLSAEEVPVLGSVST
jgi:hypothetical protein